MKKHLFYPALWGILTLSIFYSCRTDSVATEQTQQVSEKITAFERFEKANNIQPKASSKNNASSGKYVSYARPFAEIISYFLKYNPDYAQSVEQEAGSIRLDVVSQTFGNESKGVIFPVVNKSGIVVGAWGGVINKERNYAEFYYLNNSSVEVASIKTAFQEYYDKKKQSSKLQSLVASVKNGITDPIAKALDPEQEKDKPKEQLIDEVTINVKVDEPKVSLPLWWTDLINGTSGGVGSGMNGGDSSYGGGSGTVPTSTEQQDPCSGMKTQRENKDFKDGVTDLRGKTGLKKETGYVQNGTTGKYAYQENASATETSNSLTLPDAEKYNVKSYLHTHVDNYTTVNADGIEEERIGIKMFSPADVIYMMDMLRNAKTRGISFSDVSGTMVTSSGTYTLRFSGNEYQLKSYTSEQSKAYTSSYIDFMTKNPELSLEQKFLQFIDTKMNMKGIELFKLNDDGTTTKTQLNSDKSSVTTSNCPN